MSRSGEGVTSIVSVVHVGDTPPPPPAQIEHEPAFIYITISNGELTLSACCRYTRHHTVGTWADYDASDVPTA